MVDIAIIGAGPAGMMAALYASRAGKSVLLLDMLAPGGRLHSTYQVDNYLGFGKVTAQELISKMVGHLRDLDIKEERGAVQRLDIALDAFSIITDETTYQAKTIIIASGTRPKPLNVPGESAFVSRGISYCAVCDSTFFQGEDVVVIGGGDAALEESLYLAQTVKSVTIIHDLSEYTAIKGMIERVHEVPRITHLASTRVVRFHGEDTLTHVEVVNLLTHEHIMIPAQGAFIYSGNLANTAYADHLPIHDGEGFIAVDQDMATSVRGLYAAGDVTKKDHRYIVTAISDGAIAALSAVKYLDGVRKKD